MQIFFWSGVVIIVILQAVDFPSRIRHVIAERRVALTDSTHTLHNANEPAMIYCEMPEWGDNCVTVNDKNGQQ